jgi:hypothetical protein
MFLHKNNSHVKWRNWSIINNIQQVIWANANKPQVTTQVSMIYQVHTSEEVTTCWDKFEKITFGIASKVNMQTKPTVLQFSSEQTQY